MSPVLPVPGLQGMDGVPEMLIAVICCQDDLELSTTAVDADEVRAVAVDGQRHPRVAKSHKKIPLRDTPMDRRRHLDPCHRSRVCGAGPTPSWTQPRACHTCSIMLRGFWLGRGSRLARHRRIIASAWQVWAHGTRVTKGVGCSCRPTAWQDPGLIRESAGQSAACAVVTMVCPEGSAPGRGPCLSL